MAHTALHRDSPARSSFGTYGWLLLLGVAAILTVFAGLAIGAIPLSIEALLSGGNDALQRTVLFDIRMPRVLLAAFAGGALALAGASLQALFRNPLADPGLIGVSGGAAVGAIAMIVLGSQALPESFLPYAVPASAISGALLVTASLYAFAKYFGNFSVGMMLLVGIALNALSVVAIGAFEYLSDDTQLRTLVFWQMGSFGRATWVTIIPAFVLMTAASLLLLYQRGQYDVLQLGENEARFLAVDVTRLKRMTIIGGAMGVGAAVAVSGIVAFVGLVVPHLVRLLGGAEHRFVLPGSFLLGAVLCVCADLVARMVIIPAELPVGLVTSALGAPFFLWLIARSYRA
ncbi:MAG: iron ABC transporter permease [Pseudomonadota bacterium]